RWSWADGLASSTGGPYGARRGRAGLHQEPAAVRAEAAARRVGERAADADGAGPERLAVARDLRLDGPVIERGGGIGRGARGAVPGEERHKDGGHGRGGHEHGDEDLHGVTESSGGRVRALPDGAGSSTGCGAPRRSSRP